MESFNDFDFKVEDLPVMRAGMAQVAQALTNTETVDISDKTIIGIDDTELRIRIYKPAQQHTELPCLLWIHGGGYILGSVEDNDQLCVQVVETVNCVVVSVDYRLAPEYPYPAPLEDCYSALTWIADHASDLQIDANRIGVAGGSAGGGLAAGLTLLARDRAYPSICFQMPLYPMINDGNNTPSANEIKEGMIWNQKANDFGWKCYLGDLHGQDDVPIYAAPARAPGAYHGFEVLNPQSEKAQQVVKEYVNAIKVGFDRVKVGFEQVEEIK